jgi:hypothetical protein
MFLGQVIDNEERAEKNNKIKKPLKSPDRADFFGLHLLPVYQYTVFILKIEHGTQ